ncbi:unnamed protein product [Diabrotica balteata]|uniref:Uncharacterized protein n=1 Tax=Diabrotica balteata TaxID=107213 RepID=A0A9N9TAE8_DIABA|nr:unnamed protein product [Diabrotica balteata]
MRGWFLSTFLIVTLVVVVFGAPKTFEDNVKALRKINLNDVLKNDRIVRSYIDCVIGTKPCTPEGLAMKESWKEGLDKTCDKCEEEDKIKVKKVVKYIYLNHRDWYDELASTFDKDKKYQTKYQEYMDQLLADPAI